MVDGLGPGAVVGVDVGVGNCVGVGVGMGVGAGLGAGGLTSAAKETLLPFASDEGGVGRGVSMSINNGPNSGGGGGAKVGKG